MEKVLRNYMIDCYWLIQCDHTNQWLYSKNRVVVVNEVKKKVEKIVKIGGKHSEKTIRLR